jgi:hypothetical protein
MTVADRRPWLLLAVVLVVIATVVTIRPIPQDPGYHHFADTRTVFGIPNAWDVLSNLLFLLVGFLGLAVLWHRRWVPEVALVPYTVLFGGLVLTAFGSAYYHWSPDNHALVWDRLPMTIVFAGFLCSVVAELASRKVANRLLLPTMAMGMWSVYYWKITEEAGTGDLRAYGVAQFLPVLLIGLMLFLYPRPRGYTAWLLACGGLYALSKLFELLDGSIYAVGGIVSGHSLKHLVAAAALACLVEMLRRRKPIPA